MLGECLTLHLAAEVKVSRKAALVIPSSARPGLGLAGGGGAGGVLVGRGSLTSLCLLTGRAVPVRRACTPPSAAQGGAHILNPPSSQRPAGLSLVQVEM